jgi:hypothetical protein
MPRNGFTVRALVTEVLFCKFLGSYMVIPGLLDKALTRMGASVSLNCALETLVDFCLLNKLV